MFMYNFPFLYVSVQRAESASDQRSCYLNLFRKLLIIPSLEISGNSGVVKLKTFGGLLERRGIVEFLDGLPLSFGDLQNQVREHFRNTHVLFARTRLEGLGDSALGPTPLMRGSDHGRAAAPPAAAATGL